MDANEVISHEEVVAFARIVMEVGVGKQQLDPANPASQVLVAGASVIVAATDAGLGPDDVFDLIRDNAKPVPAAVGRFDTPMKQRHLSVVRDDDGKSGGTNLGGYL